MENISIIILLLFGVVFLGVLSNKYKFPFPIALVLSGLLISQIPGLPLITLNPGIVFYQCHVHPGVISIRTGNCPQCVRQLVEVVKSR